MNLLLRWLEPLNLAAYITWLAVLLSLPEHIDVAGGASLWLLWLFLAAFLLHQAIPTPRSALWTHSLVAAQALVALALCAQSPNATTPVLLVLVMAQWAMCVDLVPLAAIGVVINAALLMIFVYAWQVQKPWVYLFIYAGFQVFACLTAWYARRAQEQALDLQQVNAHLLSTRSLLEESARDSERLRLSRELHDVAGHKLTALKLNLALALRGADPSREVVQRCAQLADELLGDIRGVVSQLRLHDGMDLRVALEQLASALPRPRVRLELADGARADSVAVAEVILRTVQEALTNSARHGDASEVVVGLRREAGELVLRVRDNGRKVAGLREGNGLRGMRERAEALGAGLRIEQPAPGGVAVTLTVPMTALARAGVAV